MNTEARVSGDEATTNLGSTYEVETYVYKQVSDLKLRADVYRSSTPGSNPSPVVVWIHGGALILGTRKDIHDTRHHELARYLEQGWTLVSIDYRLGPETQVPEIWEDVRDAFVWVRESGPSAFGADVTRVAAVGPSSGGYLSLLAGAKLTVPPRAIVSWFGYGDITGDWYTKPDASLMDVPTESAQSAWASVGSSPVAELPQPHDRRRFYIYARQQGLRGKLIGGDGDPSPYCPAFLVTPSYPATLLVHGDADRAVPVKQSVQMAAALRESEVEHELVIVPGVGHSFDREATAAPAIDAIDRSMAFLARHLA
jgi:acetyl esterase/lipase